MDRVQSRILDIARQIPEYVGYQAKERRREEDKLVRRQLAQKYDESRTRLARIARQAPLDQIVAIENLDQKLQRLIARLNTAPPGYAGWFDAGQIVESDLDQLTELDEGLADGVYKLNAALQQLSTAVKSRGDIGDPVDSCADLIDGLNNQFDQREQFLAMGIKAALPAAAKPAQSPLAALNEPAKAPPELVALMDLKKGDAIAYRDANLLVIARITYTVPGGTFWAYMVEERPEARWLRVGPDFTVALCIVVDLAVIRPFPTQLQYEGTTFSRDMSATAGVYVEGRTASQRGNVAFARYSSPERDEQLWVEDFDGELRVSAGAVVDPPELKVYRRS